MTTNNLNLFYIIKINRYNCPDINTKAEKDELPTKVSQLENDSGYLTEKSKAEISSWGTPDYSAGISVGSGYVTTFPCYITAELTGKSLAAWSALVLYGNGIVVDKGINHDSGGRPEYVRGFFGVGVSVSNSHGIAMRAFPLKGIN